MPLGVILLLVVAALIFFGFAHRLLDRMYLSDVQALVILGLMIGGSFINIPIGLGIAEVSINVGGAIIPTLLAFYVLGRSDSAGERLRAIGASLATAASLYVLIKLFVFEEGHSIVDPMYVFGIAAGAIAYIVSRSRRTAFISAVFGVVLLDIIHLVENLIVRRPGPVDIGGSGVFDTIVIAGVIAGLLSELVGESLERAQGGSRTEMMEKREDEASEGEASEDEDSEDEEGEEGDSFDGGAPGGEEDAEE